MKFRFTGYRFGRRKGIGKFEVGGPNRHKGVGLTPERVAGWLKELVRPWRKP